MGNSLPDCITVPRLRFPSPRLVSAILSTESISGRKSRAVASPKIMIFVVERSIEMARFFPTLSRTRITRVSAARSSLCTHEWMRRYSGGIRSGLISGDNAALRTWQGVSRGLRIGSIREEGSISDRFLFLQAVGRSVGRSGGLRYSLWKAPASDFRPIPLHSVLEKS